MNKKNLLVICSWLDHESSIGNFFIEQGELFMDKYRVVFLCFKKKSIRNILKFKPLFDTELNITEGGNLIIYAYYPYFLKLGLRFLNFAQRISCVKVNKILKSKDFYTDLIHAHSVLEAGVFAYHFSTIFNTPYMITEHNNISFLKKNIYDYNFIFNVINKSKFNLVVSNEKIKQFASNDLFFEFEVVGNLVNDNYFTFSQEKYSKSSLGNHPFRIVTLGAYSPLKDHETLFKALQFIDPFVENVEFIWIGANSWGNAKDLYYKFFLEKYRLNNISLSVYPQLTRQEVSQVFSKSSLFVLSSLVEGFPVSVIEALASGLPVFCSRCGGVDDIIHSHNGRLFSLRDYVKLGEYILEFYKGKFAFNNKEISDEIISEYGRCAFRKKIEHYYENLS